MHVLGYSLVALNVAVGIPTMGWLWRAAVRPWSWTHPVKAPRLATGVADLRFDSGSDYVGVV
jgi:hypothetical protein